MEAVSPKSPEQVHPMYPFPNSTQMDRPFRMPGKHEFPSRMMYDYQENLACDPDNPIGMESSMAHEDYRKEFQYYDYQGNAQQQQQQQQVRYQDSYYNTMQQQFAAMHNFGTEIMYGSASPYSPSRRSPEYLSHQMNQQMERRFSPYYGPRKLSPTYFQSQEEEKVDENFSSN